MKLVSARQMQEIDRRTIDGGHVASLNLMESAGRAAASQALEMLRGVNHPRVEVLCGKGNNGGDGLVIARVLADRGGCQVRVHLTHKPAELTADARANFKRLPQAVPVVLLPQEMVDPGALDNPRRRPQIAAVSWESRLEPDSHDWWRLQTEKDAEGRATWERSEAALRLGKQASARSAEPKQESLAELRDRLQRADLCIDSLLGTGVERDLEGRLAALINLINHRSRATLSVDVPSGVDASTAEVRGTAIWADLTVTFGLPKLGLVFYPGRERTGRLVVADIGFPEAILREVPEVWSWFDAQQARQLLPRLDPTTHKYARGCVVLVAGSRSYPGAAVLAAEAALRCGAGMVHLLAPRSIRDLLETQLTEVIVHAGSETEHGTLASGALEILDQLLPRAHALAVGPGLGRVSETQECVGALLTRTALPAVVDADAIACLPMPPHAAPRVVTPHVGELANWLGENAELVKSQRVEVAARAAREHQAIVVAKGAPSVVVTPDGRRSVNGSGNPGLATAGSGDVLTGAIGSLLAQGLSAEHAAQLGVFVHGAAADLWSRSQSIRSLRARDLAASLGGALRDIETALPPQRS